MIDELIERIGKQLNITRTPNYDIWTMCRMIYSTTGQMALASLWDHSEDEKYISIQHFKKRAAQNFDAYVSVYPRIKGFFPENRENLISEIYEVYRRNGCLYHASHKISPSAFMSCEADGVALYKGISPDSKYFMSGLGFYGSAKGEDCNQKSVAEMFDLQAQPMSDYLHELLQNGEWIPIEWPERTEFLRIEPPFSHGYWKNQPDTEGKIALARYGEPSKIYAFYRYENGQFWHKIIPEWRVNDFRTVGQVGYGEYRRIAVALLDSYNVLPASTVNKNGDMIEIHLGYRLPPAEEDFFKLYSWPSNFDISDDLPQIFTRTMSASVYPLFKHQMETIGYRFEEE